MNKDSTIPSVPVSDAVDEAFADVQQSFERLCLAAGIETLRAMMAADVEAVCGPGHGRVETRQAHRWGRTRGRIGANVRRCRGQDNVAPVHRRIRIQSVHPVERDCLIRPCGVQAGSECAG